MERPCPTYLETRNFEDTCGMYIYIVCSTEDFLDKELKYLEKVFHENNDYPKYIIKQIPKQSPDQYNEQELDMIKRNFNLNEVVE